MDDKTHLDWHTRLTHVGRAGKEVAGFVNPPVHRGSTVLSPTLADRRDCQGRGLEQELVYGLTGGPTHFALEDAIAEIEGGTRCQIVCSGLAAVTTPLLAYLKSGDHLLMPDSVYGPSRRFANTLLRQMGVETTFYAPLIAPDELGPKFRPNTTVLFLESPGSHTFEVQDVPGLAEIAHARGAKVLMDNTWGIHFFQPFQHGVDVSIQALTKYAGGHSDLMLGSVTTNADQDWKRVRQTAKTLGQFASPDDCWLALRGVRTMAVRLDRQQESGLIVARWLAERPEIARVLHPALPTCPGHEFWRRDFSGASSLFGVVFRPEYQEKAIEVLAETLRLFGIGASWGGYESLVLPASEEMIRTTSAGKPEGRMMRFHVGLEHPDDLIADLVQGLAAMREVGAGRG